MNTQDIIEYIVNNIRQPIWENWYIKEKIGSGAFSAVFRAEAQRFDKVHCSALKIEPIVLSGSQAMANDEWKQHYLESKLQMVKNESAIMYKLRQCPNIVAYEEEDLRKLEIDGKDEGYYFLIRMELLKNVCDMIKDKTFSFSEENIIKLAKDIGNGIKAAHDINIIHRDIKPSNFFMSDDGIYKLGDFNISKQTVSSNSFAGTEGYIAPEIYRARADSHESYTTQADIYSFGICLYQMMNNGLLPFEENHLTEEAITIRMQGAALPKPANASPDFAGIILKASAFEPSARYMTIAEMLRDIENIGKVPTSTMSGMSYDTVPLMPNNMIVNSSYGQPIQPSGYNQPIPPNSNYGQPIPPNSSYGQPIPPNSSYGQSIPPNSIYNQPANFRQQYNDQQNIQNQTDSGNTAKIFLILLSVMIIMGAGGAAAYLFLFSDKNKDDDDDDNRTEYSYAEYSEATEPAQEIITEPPTELLTEPVTEPPTAAVTEPETTAVPPTEPPTQPPTEPPTEPPTLPPFPEFNDPPVFTTVTASSVCAPVSIDGKWYKYDPVYAADNNNETAWIEGIDGYGEGEYIEFSAPALQTVSKIKIINGLATNDELYYKNGRVEECLIEFSDGSSVTVFLTGNSCGYVDVIELPEPVNTTSVKFTIKSAFLGTKYEDTCIADISFE